MAKKAENESKKKAGSKKAGASKGRVHWLDDKTSAPLIDTYAQNLDTFIATMADGRVDQEELQAQEGRLVKLMKEVEPLLDDELHEKVTRLLCELTAYDIMQLLHSMDAARPKSKFQG
jgi:hypothetical protein